MNLTQFSARAVASFLRELSTDGAPVPVAAMNAVALLDDILSGDPAQTLRPSTNPTALMASDPATFADAIRAEALWMVVGSRAGDAAVVVTDATMKAAVDLTRERADDLLDHYRPRFDRAIATIAAAVEAGVRYDMTSDDLVIAGPSVVAAWQPVPGAAAVLDRIASKRSRMCELLDIAPVAQYQHSAMPGAARTMWPIDTAYAVVRLPEKTHRSGPAYWLRLASLGPVTLHTVAQTIAAERATRPPIRVAVVENDHGRAVMNVH